MGPEKLKTMEKWNLLFGAVLSIVAALLFSRAVALGVAAGAALCCVNFWSIRKIWEAVLSGSPSERKRAQILFLLKSLVLIGLVFVVVRFLPIHPIAFAAGISVFFLSIAVESVRFAFTGAAAEKHT
jgi:hypothetical protein